MTNEKDLFQKGIDAFNNHQFYDAHEYWEELWLDYKLTDASFIQGLIQLAVSYFHLLVRLGMIEVLTKFRPLMPLKSEMNASLSENPIPGVAK